MKTWIRNKIFNIVDKHFQEHPQIVQITDRVQLEYSSATDIHCARKAINLGMEFNEDWVLEKNPVFICDLGANAGYFPLYIYNHTGSKPVGIAVEAGLRSFYRMQRNFELNNLFNFIPIYGMVGENEGTKFQINKSLVLSSAMLQQLSKEPAVYIAEEEPPILKADYLWKHDSHQGDILKIDIEGSEYGLFSRTSYNFFLKFRKILVEWHEPMCGLDFIRSRLAVAEAFKLTFCHYIGRSQKVGYAYFDRILNLK